MTGFFSPPDTTFAMLVLAFAGGTFGAAIGPLLSFSLCGFVVLFGETLRLAAPGPAPVDLTTLVAFGVVLGPHISFGGGAAALAYVAQEGARGDSFKYHPAKNVTVGLGSRWDVLMVGGGFGVAGYGIAEASRQILVPVDPVAFGVVVSAFLHRFCFGYSIVGRFELHGFEWLPESPAVPASPSRTEPWLPYQSRWRDVSLLGGCMGALGGYLAFLTGSSFFAFGLSVASLIFLCCGVARIPVTHHMTLPASTVVLAQAGAFTGNLDPRLVEQGVGMTESVLIGSLFGLIGGMAGELFQRIFYAQAETHLDPPAASIVLTSLMIALLAMVDLLPAAAWIPSPG